LERLITPGEIEGARERTDLQVRDLAPVPTKIDFYKTITDNTTKKASDSSSRDSSQEMLLTKLVKWL